MTTTRVDDFTAGRFVHVHREAAESGVPNGNRTRVAAVKGRCPRPLDDRDAAGARPAPCIVYNAPCVAFVGPAPPPSPSPSPSPSQSASSSFSPSPSPSPSPSQSASSSAAVFPASLVDYASNRSRLQRMRLRKRQSKIEIERERVREKERGGGEGEVRSDAFTRFSSALKNRVRVPLR